MFKKIIAMLLAIVLCLSCITLLPATEVEAAAAGTGYYRITASSGLRVRSGAGTSYSHLTTIPYGIVVNVTQISSNWGKTTYGSYTGWICLDYASKTTAPVTGSNVNVIGALAELRVKFPDGKYWNKRGGASSQDAYSTLPCTDHSTATYANCKGQCTGFVVKLGLDMYGTSPYYYWTKINTPSTGVSDVCIGDIIRYNSKHTIMVTDIIGNDLVVVDCNWDRQCGIDWDRTFSVSRYITTVNYIYHNPYNKFKSTDSTLYVTPESGMQGKLTVTGTSLNVYTSADADSTVVGIVIADDGFYYYDTKTVSGTKWYKIKLNTVYGWVNGSGVSAVPTGSDSTTSSTDIETSPTDIVTSSTDISDSTTTTTATTTTTTATSPAILGRVKITGSVLNVRKGAGTSYAVVTTVKKGAAYDYTATKTVSGVVWYKIIVSSSVTGWVSGDYITKVATTTASTTTTTATTTTTTQSSAESTESTSTTATTVVSSTDATTTSSTESSETSTSTQASETSATTTTTTTAATTTTTTTTAASTSKVKITGSVVNVRKGAGTSYAVVTTVKKGATYTYTATKTVSGVVWYKIQVSSSVSGWVCGTYASKVSTATTTTTAASTSKVKITGSVVNVRKGAGTSYAVVTTVKKGATYTYTATKTVSGVVWYKIQISSSVSGWVIGTYAKKV